MTAKIIDGKEFAATVRDKGCRTCDPFERRKQRNSWTGRGIWLARIQPAKFT